MIFSPTDSANIITFILIDIPLVWFLARNWKMRNENGMIKIVREVATWFVLMFFIRNTFTLVLRILVASGVSIKNELLDTLSFLTNIGLMLATMYGAIVFREISKRELKKKENCNDAQ